MGQGQGQSLTQRRIGIAVALLAITVAITPLVLSLIAARNESSPTGLVIGTAITWLLAVVAYRGLSNTYEHQRRRALREQIAELRQARNEATSAFQDRLLEQQAILERIRDISDRMIDEGIIDPTLAINNVRLMQSHARDAQVHIDDSIIEAQVAIGAESVFVETLNVRDQVEEVVAQFARKGSNTITSGPTLYGETDAAMFRLILRSLINGAVARDAGQIDVTVASDGDHVVCTVSDDGADTSKLGLKAVSGLARSLVATLDVAIDCSNVLGRNRYAIAVPRVDAPAEAEKLQGPVDVLGNKPRSEEPQEVLPASPRLAVVSDLVTFERDAVDRTESIAEKRERQVAPR
ncbi:MAG: hypothetical protein QNJ75_09665 [Acidimicrobiia bacterium]|nr:hypothetical protein [Acidimicrobiia bacterium]